MKAIVITTINSETEAIKKFKSIQGWDLILVGDKKTPEYNDEKIKFIPANKHDMNYKISNLLPFNTYSRKNIGYIEAIKSGAEIIYESDDDNIPYEYWSFDGFEAASILNSSEKFANIYSFLSGVKQIWARGFPLEYVTKQIDHNTIPGNSKIGVWQTLIDHDPDVDAIYRLTINKPMEFGINHRFAVRDEVYAPFNSQSTFWSKDCFPYMYFPSTVSWRFADILRSYITQKLLWHDGLRLGFSSSIVYQDRFRNDYMKDFIDEIPLYTQVLKTIDVLEKIELSGTKYENLLKIYEELSKVNIVKEEEINILNVWIHTLKES